MERELELEDKIIELADYVISKSTTYREAKIACEKLLRQVAHEIELRALESETRVRITNRTVLVKTSDHDVLLTARKPHPAVFVDGIFLDGVERVEFINHFADEL